MNHSLSESDFQSLVSGQAITLPNGDSLALQDIGLQRLALTLDEAALALGQPEILQKVTTARAEREAWADPDYQLNRMKEALQAFHRERAEDIRGEVERMRKW